MMPPNLQVGAVVDVRYAAEGDGDIELTVTDFNDEWLEVETSYGTRYWLRLGCLQSITPREPDR